MTLALGSVAGPRPAAATCNAIPAAALAFPSDLGEVSTPFARPGQRVAVYRDQTVFASDETLNRVTVTFAVPGGPGIVVDAVALPPEEGQPCAPADCDGESCRCAAFAFPDTDALVGEPQDGRALTGPATITVENGDVTIARIGALFARAGGRDLVFASFVALPIPNAFRVLLPETGADVLAAADDAGNLLIPFDFTGVAAEPTVRVLPLFPIVEARVPGLGALGDVEFASFTSDGRRLAVTAIRIGDSDDLFGTADGLELVLRVAGVAARVPFVPDATGGPIVIPGVTGWADPRKRADANTLVLGDRFAVYENPECSIYVPQDYCVDLNADGDTTDHFLRAFDVTVPRAEPVVIDEVDERALPGDPPLTTAYCPYILLVFGHETGFPPFGLYRFTASDTLVQFAIPETTCFNLDQDGRSAGLITSGAFDLARGQAIELARGARHREVAGDLLAFGRAEGERGDTLYVYDAGAADPMARPIHDARHRRFFVPVGDGPMFDYWGFSSFGRTIDFPTGFSVSETHVAFQVDESVQGEDLTGDGRKDGFALFLYDARKGRVRNLRQQTVSRPSRLRLTGRWLMAEVPRPSLRQSVAVYDLTRPRARRRLICDQGRGGGHLVSSSTDELLACVTSDIGYRPDLGDIALLPQRGYIGYPLHVFDPEGPGGGVETHLGLAVGAPDDVRISGRTLAVGVGELGECRDLNGDGVIGGGSIGGLFGTPSLVHVFNARTGQIANLGAETLISREPVLVLGKTFLGAISPEAVFGTGSAETRSLGTSFWDLDGDGNFDLAPTLASPARPADGSCTAASDCADGDVCTVDACVDGRCAFTPGTGIVGVDCALGKLAASACGGVSLRTFVRKRTREAFRALPINGCSNREFWLPAVEKQLARIERRLARTSGACRTTLGGLVAAVRGAAAEPVRPPS